jgi:hypothetical protein
MKRIARNDFTLPHYEIESNGISNFDEYIDFKKDDVIKIEMQQIKLGTIISVVSENKT